LEKGGQKTMAFVTQFVCKECGNTKTEVVTSSRICATCRGNIAQIEEAAYLARMDKLPLATRIRKLELELYRMDVDSRLKSLEAYHVRY
jgi:hypothetical protein